MASTQWSKTQILLALHEYLDWMHRWGSPRSPREEANFYEERVKIEDHEMDFKPLLQRLKLYLERFVDDFEKEPKINTEVGTYFLQEGSAMLEAIEASKEQFNDEGPLVQELDKVMKVSLQRVKSLMNKSSE